MIPLSSADVVGMIMAYFVRAGRGQKRAARS
jgi:hypothetical protein